MNHTRIFIQKKSRRSIYHRLDVKVGINVISLNMKLDSITGMMFHKQTEPETPQIGRVEGSFEIHLSTLLI